MLAIAERSGEVRRWRLGGAEAVAPLGGTRGEVLGLAFSPRDDEVAAAGGDGVAAAVASPAAR